ncbi:hypothetical protein BaRGS_00038345, partial [Batillaria attramentaria]
CVTEKDKAISLPSLPQTAESRNGAHFDPPRSQPSTALSTERNSHKSPDNAKATDLTGPRVYRLTRGTLPTEVYHLPIKFNKLRAGMINFVLFWSARFVIYIVAPANDRGAIEAKAGEKS